MDDMRRKRVRAVLASGIAVQAIGLLYWFIQAIRWDSVEALICLATGPVAYAIGAWALWTLSGAIQMKGSQLRLALRGFAVASAVLAIGFMALSTQLSAISERTAPVGALVEVVGTIIAAVGFWLLGSAVYVETDPAGT